MKKELIIGLFAAALTIGMASTVTAQSQDSNVTVDVASDVAIDVRPSVLAYTASGEEGALNPGATRRVSDNDYEHIELENIGSETLDNIYVEATAQVNNSFGDASANNHDTGNFVTVSTETASTGSYNLPGLTEINDHHYINRVEYFEDLYPTYLDVETESDVTVDGTTITNSVQEVGRFRVGNGEYFFVIYSDSSSGPTNVGLRIGQTPHTPTELGTTDFTDSGSDYYEAEISGNNPTSDVFAVPSFDLVSFNESEYEGDTLLNGNSADLTGTSIEGNESTETRNYALYFDLTNRQSIRSALNVGPESPDGDWSLSDESGKSGVQYIVSAPNEDEALQPGQNFPVDIGVQVPLGVDRDRISQGTVTIRASQWTS